MKKCVGRCGEPVGDHASSTRLGKDPNASEIKLLFSTILEVQFDRGRDLPPTTRPLGGERVVAPDLYLQRAKGWHGNPAQLGVVHSHNPQPFRPADPAQADLVLMPGTRFHWQSLHTGRALN